MIKELRIQPRGTGKTTWAVKLAKDLEATYINGQRSSRNDFRKFYSRPQTFVIDEFLLANLELMRGIIQFKDKHDFYLIGTMYADHKYYPKCITDYIKQYHPEQLI